jgi:Thymidylate synthase complementing protein
MSASPAPGLQFRSDVTVELVRASAADADVLFAARVSTLGEATLESAVAGPAREAATARDRGLINYLMRDRHGSPFEHNLLSLRRRVDGAAFPCFPQREIEMCAERMEVIWQDLMPLTWAAFNDHARIAP